MPQEPYLGELMLVPYNFAPKGWALCQGQILSISSNTALFSLLGTTYGGDGRTNFALPNLQGQAPISAGQGPGLTNYSLGEVAGVSSVTLTNAQMPLHNHLLNCNTESASSASPVGAVPALASSLVYNPSGDGSTMNPAMMAASGGNQPHDNTQPYLVLNWCIAVAGIFPQRP